MRNRTLALGSPMAPGAADMVVPSRVRVPLPSTAAAHSAMSTPAVVVFLALHIPLALTMDRVSAVSTMHALAVLAIGGWWAISSPRVDRTAMVVGYLAGAEVLWRMTDAQINWEFGKYAASAVMLLSLLRRRNLRPAALPLVYFALLLPSAALTIVNETWSVAQNQLSFNLSGPFAILMAGWFFSTARLSEKDLRSFWIALIAPSIGVAAITMLGTFTADVSFQDSSNFATSGGYGPNQVSATLGLGALAAFYLALDGTATRILRYLMVVILIGLATDSALTFSRGGLYMAAGGAFFALAFALKDSRLRMRLLPVLGLMFVIANYAVLPYLDAFTGGEISVRFLDTGLTGRDRLIQGDIELFQAHPLIGVGPGEGGAERARVFVADAPVWVHSRPRTLAAHTEFSRLLSEHGLFGLASLLIYIAAVFTNVKRAPDPRSQAIVAGLACWSALFMATAAMRVFAPSLAFGIGFASFVTATVQKKEGPRSRLAPRPRGSTRPLTPGHPSLGGHPVAVRVE